MGLCAFFFFQAEDGIRDAQESRGLGDCIRDRGTAADIIKIAMIKVWKALKDEGLKSRLILQVHDELLIETAQDEEARVRKILTENMKSAADLAVTLEIDLHTGSNWYEAK